MTPLKIAFVGLGAMGLPMARRLSLRSEFDLSIYDARPEVLEAESHLGRVASSVADAIGGADYIFSVLPADRHVQSVANEIDAAAPTGVFVDFSTIASATITDVGSRLAAVGVRTLGAAVSRSVAAAEVGELTIFIGGEPDLIERLKPALEQMASDIRIVDTAGAAKAVKIFNNMVVSGLDLVICDTLLIGAMLGVRPHQMTDVLMRGGADSWPLRNHIVKHLLTGELAPGRFSTRYMGKDAALAAQLAEDVGEPAWIAGLVGAAYRGTDALGFGDHYHPVVLRWFERAANIDPITPDFPDRAGELSDDAQAVAATLCAGVIAQQALMTLDALRLVGLHGVPLSAALDHFDSGAAGNDCIAALRGQRAHAGTSHDLARVVADLGAVCALAASVPTPAMTFEVAKHVALGMLSRYGKHTTIGQLARLASVSTS